MKSKSKAKLNVSSPEYRDMVQNLLGKKVVFEDIKIPIKNEEQNVVQTKSINPQRVTGNKDVDSIVLKKLDDKSLLSLLQVNKEYEALPDTFFEQRLQQKFPFLVRYKPSDISWKQYYLKNVHYIGKLKEEYDLDYVSFPGTSSKPEKIYKKLSQSICLQKLYVKDSRKMKEIAREIIDNARMTFYIYEKRRNDILKILKERDDDSTTHNIAEEVLNSGDLEFYEQLKKKYPFVTEEYMTKDPKKEILLKAIKQGDLSTLKNNMPDILKEYEKEYENFESDYVYYLKYKDLLYEAVKSGELDVVEYIMFNISPKFIETRKEYEKMIENAIVEAIIWDNPNIFNYLYKIVSSFKNKNNVISSLRKEVKNVAICIPDGEKYFKRIK